MKLADALSKIHTHSDQRFHVDVIYHINSIINDIPISDETWGELRQQTGQDNSIIEEITLLKEGKRLPAKFNSHIHEFHVIDGLLFSGDRDGHTSSHEG